MPVFVFACLYGSLHVYWTFVGHGLLYCACSGCSSVGQCWTRKGAMARTLKDSKLDKAEARRKLEARGKPFYRLIEEGLRLGYRRMSGRAGTWCVRRYVENRRSSVSVIGIADDNSDAVRRHNPRFCASAEQGARLPIWSEKKGWPLHGQGGARRVFRKDRRRGQVCIRRAASDRAVRTAHCEYRMRQARC